MTTTMSAAVPSSVVENIRAFSPVSGLMILDAHDAIQLLATFVGPPPRRDAVYVADRVMFFMYVVASLIESISPAYDAENPTGFALYTGNLLYRTPRAIGGIANPLASISSEMLRNNDPLEFVVQSWRKRIEDAVLLRDPAPLHKLLDHISHVLPTANGGAGDPLFTVPLARELINDIQAAYNELHNPTTPADQPGHLSSMSAVRGFKRMYIQPIVQAWAPSASGTGTGTTGTNTAQRDLYNRSSYVRFVITALNAMLVAQPTQSDPLNEFVLNASALQTALPAIEFEDPATATSPQAPPPLSPNDVALTQLTEAQLYALPAALRPRGRHTAFEQFVFPEFEKVTIGLPEGEPLVPRVPTIPVSRPSDNLPPGNKTDRIRGKRYAAYLAALPPAPPSTTKRVASALASGVGAALPVVASGASAAGSALASGVSALASAPASGMLEAVEQAHNDIYYRLPRVLRGNDLSPAESERITKEHIRESTVDSVREIDKMLSQQNLKKPTNIPFKVYHGVQLKIERLQYLRSTSTDPKEREQFTHELNKTQKQFEKLKKQYEHEERTRIARENRSLDFGQIEQQIRDAPRDWHLDWQLAPISQALVRVRPPRNVQSNGQISLAAVPGPNNGAAGAGGAAAGAAGGPAGGPAVGGAADAAGAGGAADAGVGGAAGAGGAGAAGGAAGGAGGGPADYWFARLFR